MIEIAYSDGVRERLADIDTRLYSLGIFSAASDALRIRQQRDNANVSLEQNGVCMFI